MSIKTIGNTMRSGTAFLKRSIGNKKEWRIMLKWRNGFIRTALVALGVGLLGNFAGLTAMAAATGSDVPAGGQNEGPKTAYVTFDALEDYVFPGFEGHLDAWQHNRGRARNGGYFRWTRYGKRDSWRYPESGGGQPGDFHPV